jgi:hypothetical protein
MKIEIKHKGSCVGTTGGSGRLIVRDTLAKGHSIAGLGSLEGPCPGSNFPGERLLFQLISKLYERSSLIVTTSYGPSSRRWQPIKPVDDQVCPNWSQSRRAISAEIKCAL